MNVNKTIFATILLAFLAPALVFANERDEPFYSSEEMAIAYRYQYWYGPRLTKPIKEIGDGNYLTTVYGHKVNVPKKFVERVTEHMVQMIRAGSAKYIFRLDLGHGHMFFPKEALAKYKSLPENLFLEAILNDPALGILYHASEFLAYDVDKSPSDVREWKSKRNVVGRFDGRPIQILRPHPSGAGVGLVDDYAGDYEFLNNITMMGHRFGAVKVLVTGKKGEYLEYFDMDISFESY